MSHPAYCAEDLAAVYGALYLTEADLKLWRIRQKSGKKGKGRREAA